MSIIIKSGSTSDTADVTTNKALKVDLGSSSTFSTKIWDGTNAAAVLNTVPTGTEYALAVRTVGSGAGTSSSFTSAFPATGTAVGFYDGTNMQGAHVFDLDTGAGTQYILGVGLRLSSSGGSVEAGTGSNPLRIDPTGTTIQPVSGTITANAGSGTFTVGGTVTANAGSGTFTVGGTVTANIGTSGSLALDATLAKLTIAQGASLGSNTQALIGGSVTTAAPSYTTGQISPLSLTTSGLLRTDGSGVTQPISGTITANAGSGTFTVSGTVTANQGGAPWSFVGTKTSNSAAPSTNNIGTLPAVANTAAPSFSDGNQVALSTDLAGSLRVVFTNAQATGSIADKTTFTYGTTGEVPVGGAFQDTSPALTAGQSGVVRLTANRGFHVNLRDASGNEKLGQLTMANSIPVAIASDQSNVGIISVAVVSAANSSTATLGSGATFTGTSESTLNYQGISVSVMAIGATAPPGTLIVEQSSDGANWDVQDTYNVTGGTASPTGEFDVIVNVIANFFRIVYTNGATAQTAFRLQTVKLPTGVSLPNTVQKATQAPLFVPTQAVIDSGRVVKIYTAQAVAGVTTEAMMTLTPYTDFTAGGTGTSFSVTAGKRFRVEQLVATVRATAATAVGGVVNLRISSSGAVTTATAIMGPAGTGQTAAIIGSAITGTINFPDGLELSGTMQFGVSQLMSATSASVYVSLIGFEY